MKRDQYATLYQFIYIDDIFIDFKLKNNLPLQKYKLEYVFNNWVNICKVTKDFSHRYYGDKSPINLLAYSTAFDMCHKDHRTDMTAKLPLYLQFP